jgi:C1A family cysteine protease
MSRHKVDLKQSIPSTWNWTAQGVVPNVGNQEKCGDCYAWSAIGAVESALAIKNNGTNTNGTYTGNYFSVQQVTACSNAYGNNGCGGGNFQNVWQYMASNPVVQAIYYPFTAGGGNLTGCATITNATAPYA